MGNAQGSSSRVCVVKEVTWATPPSTPVMLILPVTKCDVKLSKSTLQDNTLSSDRMVHELRHGMKTVSGSIDANHRYGDFDDLTACALQGAWVSDVLKNGKTESSFTIEKGFTDIGQYMSYTGCMVNKFSMSIKPDAIVTATFEFIGKSANAVTTTPLDASPDAYSTNPPFDSFTGTITEGGSAIGFVTGLDFSVDNGMSGSQVIGANTINDLVSGNSKVTGTLTAYFQTAALVNKFINETESAIVCTLTDLNGKDWIINFPRVKYTGGDPDIAGEGAIELSMPFEALYHTATGASLQITRSAT